VLWTLSCGPGEGGETPPPPFACTSKKTYTGGSVAEDLVVDPAPHVGHKLWAELDLAALDLRRRELERVPVVDAGHVGREEVVGH